MSDQGFLAQLHLHTAESSACGRDPAAAMMRACKREGYSLVVVTDHFLNANTSANRRDPWPKQVETLLRGYRAAKAEGDRIGLTVLFGWETFNDGPEFLTYGLGEEFLLSNPDIARLSATDYLLRIEGAGGFVSHAHPYRKAGYIPAFTPQHEHLEAYEVYNANHNPAFNEPALKAARRYGMIELAGSDAHDTDEVGGGAVRLPWPVRDIDGLVEALRTRQCEVIERL